jgi:glycosyltransferase involved in cell wall biosynthesis
VKLAIVVQRYAAAINGGAELHARYVAEHLARHAEVDVLTTCAADYVTWRNEWPAGEETINGIRVRRFPVTRERDVHTFAARSVQVFERRHSLADEIRWLEAEGPRSPALVAHVRRHARDYDFYLFFSYRYYQSFFGARAAAPRAVLVPTAERDPAIGLALFQPVFRGVRAVMYNSPEEQAMIQAVSGNHAVPGVVVGIGSDVPDRADAERFRQSYGIAGPFAIYVGRIDENKGCRELFRFFEAYQRDVVSDLSLVLVGKAVLPVPDHPKIRHLGFLNDADKFDAIAASELLIMPSYFESLSIVALEAWALGRPIVANGNCDVLRGQCARSNAGLPYEDYPEFAWALWALERNRPLARALGANGRRFFGAHYAWPVIERKYLDMFERLRGTPAPPPIEPLPGWFARRRRNVVPAEAIVARVPRGTASAAGAVGGSRADERPIDQVYAGTAS